VSADAIALLGEPFCLTLPPVEPFSGTMPIHTDSCRPFLSSAGSVTR
jgi:hypothetical protein